MEKVKLTQEQANAIEWIKEDRKYRNDLSIAVAAHVEASNEWYGVPKAVNKMPLDNFISALYIGYEVEEAYKAGDWVWGHGGYLGRIDHFDGEKFVGVWFDESNCDYAMRCKAIAIRRLATPEEVKAEKERGLWKTIGREYREIKIGDKYVHTGYEKPRTTSIHQPTDVPHLLNRLQRGVVTTFYPVESAVSFEGDSDE